MKYNIEMDFSRDGLFDDLGKTRLKDSYMREDEQSPQQRFAYVSAAFA
jgi:ribonucleoside-diphosphate reductase alpha chain